MYKAFIMDHDSYVWAEQEDARHIYNTLITELELHTNLMRQI